MQTRYGEGYIKRKRERIRLKLDDCVGFNQNIATLEGIKYELSYTKKPE